MLGMIQSNRRALGIPRKTIALTFDDGPVPNGQTTGLLDLLKSEGIQAGFCLVGRRIPGNESIVQRIESEGHLIVNQGDKHIPPERLTSAQFQSELCDFDSRVRSALSVDEWRSEYYRPPGGRRSFRLDRFLKAGGYSLMPMTYFAWDVFPIPFRFHLVLAGMLADLRINQGGLYMLHEAVVPLSGETTDSLPRDGRTWILRVVKEFISEAKADGFEFVSPEELIVRQVE